MLTTGSQIECLERVAISCGWKLVNQHSIIHDFNAWFEAAKRAAWMEVDAKKYVAWMTTA